MCPDLSVDRQPKLERKIETKRFKSLTSWNNQLKYLASILEYLCSFGVFDYSFFFQIHVYNGFQIIITLSVNNIIADFHMSKEDYNEYYINV